MYINELAGTRLPAGGRPALRAGVQGGHGVARSRVEGAAIAARCVVIVSAVGVNLADSGSARWKGRRLGLVGLPGCAVLPTCLGGQAAGGAVEPFAFVHPPGTPAGHRHASCEAGGLLHGCGRAAHGTRRIICMVVKEKV